MSDYDSDKIHSVKGDVYGVSETQLVEDCTIIKLSPLYNALPFGYSRSRMITRFGRAFAQRAAALLGGLWFVSAYGLASSFKQNRQRHHIKSNRMQYITV
ncbi:hypothetical protein JCM8547_005835 [Rhodosporidiobolus lusitaniae]